MSHNVVSEIDFNGPIVIRTKSGSIYRFGPVETAEGERDVTKDNGTLPFTRGILMGSGTAHPFFGGTVDSPIPLIGLQLAMKAIDNEQSGSWFSTKIVSIEQG